jgi:hypothetical protein
MSGETIVRDQDGKLDRRIANAQTIVAIDLLDEIANSLKDLKEYEQIQQCEGEERGWSVDVDDSVQEVMVRDPVTGNLVAAHTASIFNDGGPSGANNIVHICVNYPHNPGQLELKKGDTQQIDYSKAKKKITAFYVSCDSGKTATLRIHIKY